jgi:hypothetical protein
MGNTPSSMKDLPYRLSSDEYVEITTNDKKKYYVFPRKFVKQVGNSVKQGFSEQSLKLSFIGHGLGLGNSLSQFNNDLQQETKSWFYITEKPDPDDPPLPTSVNDMSLKGYIKLFQLDAKILHPDNKFDLEKSTFELKKLKPKPEETKANSFGKMKNNLKQLKKDLKTLKRC